MNRMTIGNALQALDGGDEKFQVMFEYGSLVVEFYKPEKVDDQQPHKRDEVYVIASGRGTFFNGESRQSFEVGEVLFVPAGVEHRFEDFSDDFATWVFFYGPIGGEGE